MRHVKAEEWEGRLKAVFDRIDERLEKEHGRMFTLHPARPEHGATASREMDGLFDIGASFSAGFGSQHGPGYVIDVRIATLSSVSDRTAAMVEEEVASMLREELPAAFPGRNLEVLRDHHVLKIVGDLNLDT